TDPCHARKVTGTVTLEFPVDPMPTRTSNARHALPTARPRLPEGRFVGPITSDRGHLHGANIRNHSFLQGRDR
ncbi:MAG: hypothetical protein QOC79_2177, partial [Actinomycetota bacterium]|nr:hypothetical protein [Actinomycetota bacterium]